MPLQEGKRKNVNHINFGFVLPSFCYDILEVHGPQRIGKPELLPHGMANVDGVSTKPLDQNSAHKWVKVNTMLSHRDLYDLCRTPLADFLDRVNQAAVATQRPSHRALESIERLPLKSVLIASEMLANLLKLSHVAGTKSLELATPLAQAPYDVLRNNIGRLTKRSKWEKHGRSQSNHPLAKDPALVEMMVRHWAHVHGVCDSLGQCRHFPQETSKSSGHIEFDYLQSDRLHSAQWQRRLQDICRNADGIHLHSVVHGTYWECAPAILRQGKLTASDNDAGLGAREYHGRGGRGVGVRLAKKFVFGNDS